jgi:hypothetical protein
LLNWPQTADFSIDFNQLAGQGLKPAELGDLLFGLAHGWLRREILCHCFSANLLRELKVGTMPGIIGLGAMALRFSASAERTGDGTRLEIAEIGDLLDEFESVVKKSRKWVVHGASLLLKYHILQETGHKKRKLAFPDFYVAHPFFALSPHGPRIRAASRSH